MSGNNFPDWRFHVSGRKKLEQVLNAFSDCMDPSIPKYICAPCSNCKGQFRNLLSYYDLWENHRILYGGLAELIVNAMTDVRPGFIEWEWHSRGMTPIPRQLLKAAKAGYRAPTGFDL